MHILIAEDDEIIRDMLAEHLDAWGHKVIKVSDGAEALTVLSKINFNIDMLITDWTMPHIDGLELSRRVRDLSSSGQYIYTILLTAHNLFEDRMQAFAIGGVDDFITKPFDLTELQLRIQVGNRVIRAERSQRLYSQSLERVVRQQTEAIRETQQEIIGRLISALESRDQETGGHVQRIGTMSAFIGKALGWSQQQVDAIEAAAPLHDIGKIGIADNILLKPGPLTKEEFDAIKQHTLIGAGILSNSRNPVIQMAEIVAKYHHENWDGTGYPYGLRGTAIPLHARVVAIVDVYDALLSDRIYRPAIPEKEAREMIRKNRSKKFDPEVCDVMLDNLEAMQRAVEQSQSQDIIYDPTILSFG